MVLSRFLRRHGAGMDKRRRLVAAILTSFYGRVPSDRTVEEHARHHGASGDLADCAASILRALNFEAAPHFVPPGHFYSPIPPVAEVDAHLARLEGVPVPTGVAGVDLDGDAMGRLWREMVPLLDEVPFGAGPVDALRYQFDNPAYAWGDGSVLYAMLRRFGPKRIVEIGSGWSTICTLDTIDRHFDHPCHVTLIEPYPELVRSLLRTGRGPDVVLECGVQDAPLSTFDALERDDILFIDSTHVARTGSDVCHEIFEILPRLKPGVLVHFHDIFWPFEYPRDWAVDENRAWNEIYLLRAFLSNTDQWRIVMFNDYMAKTHRDLIASTYPAFLRNPGGSIWLRRS